MARLPGSTGRHAGDRRIGRTLLAALALAGALLPGCEPRETRPDVWIILLDTLRPDHLGFYGYESETAPFLAKLTARATVFTDAASSSSWTAPSTASLFTSLHPVQHGVVRGFYAQRIHVEQARRRGSTRITVNRLRSDRPTLPELFQAAGYRTVGVAANINIGPEMGFNRGFHRFVRLPYRHSAETREPLLASFHSDYAPAEEVLDTLLAWESELRDAKEPLFLYVHLNDPHRPYHKREPWYRPDPSPDGRALSAYDSEIRYADEMLRRLHARLERDRDMLRVIVSDHGEEFGEHGGRGHPWSLYGELNRILLTIEAPAGAGAVSDAPVSILDVLPTLLELAGLPPPGGLGGRSLAPLILATPEAHALRESLRKRLRIAHRRSTYGEELWAVISPRWKLLNDRGHLELYDIREDPGERTNLARSFPEAVRALQRELHAFRERAAGAETGRAEIELDPDDLAALEALGYVEAR